MDNKLLYDYNVKIQRELKSICKPLKDYLHLNFGYMKIYPDGSYFLLNDDLNFVSQFILTLEKDTIFCEKYIGELNNKHRFTYTLWPKTPTDHPSMQLHFNAGYWNGMDVFYKGEDYLELWWFSRQLNSDNYTDEEGFYCRNTETLTKFILYFKKYSAQLLGEFNKKDFAVFEKGFDFSTAEFIPEEYNRISHFLQELSNKALTINGSVVKFSPREIECLKYLGLGKTAKETAKTLVISPRTVETHLKNIKLKTGYSSKSDLIKLFEDGLLS